MVAVCQVVYFRKTTDSIMAPGLEPQIIKLDAGREFSAAMWLDAGAMGLRSENWLLRSCKYDFFGGSVHESQLFSCRCRVYLPGEGLYTLKMVQLFSLSSSFVFFLLSSFSSSSCSSAPPGKRRMQSSSRCNGARLDPDPVASAGCLDLRPEGRMPEEMPDRMPERMSEYIPERMSENMSDRIAHRMSIYVTENAR